MRTYPIYDEAGVMFAFEIGNAVFARRFAAVLRGIAGVSNVRPRRFWVGCPDVHIRFCYYDREYIVWEPWGDSSRWWIGPDDDEAPSESAADLERAIAALPEWWPLRSFGR